MSARILLADDDASLRLVLSQALAREGYSVRATGSAPTLAKWVRDGEGDLVVSDVYMGDDCLFDALPGLKAARPELPVIVMSGQSTVMTALSAAGAGAYDYLPKPFDLDDLVQAVRRALSGKPDAKARAGAANAEREEKLPLIGRSAAMQEVYRVMARVAGSDLTVLIEGESGTGKERAARAIHAFSRRKSGPFAPVSLAGSEEAIERALFGRDGASGALAQADRGTLFLDDIDDMPPGAQMRLLRALHEGGGGDRGDVRIIAASKRSLVGLSAAGAFRPDLLYRLNVVTIIIPPLRERLDDLADLARAFLVRARREGLPEKHLDASAIEALKGHSWPGNVRELENLLKRAAALRPEPIITAREIAHELRGARVDVPQPASVGVGGFEDAVRRRIADELQAALAAPDAGAGLYDKLVADLEKPLIALTLEATRGNQIRAAALLGLNRNTLRKKIVTHGIKPERSG